MGTDENVNLSSPSRPSRPAKHIGRVVHTICLYLRFLLDRLLDGKSNWRRDVQILGCRNFPSTGDTAGCGGG
jgi:hypothetical protein